MKAALVKSVECGIIPLVCAAFIGCAREAAPPNIILVTIDTLRPDHLSCYGYGRETSPFIDGLAARGTLFRNAYATSSWTPPSMASIFTSLYPRSHGVNHGHLSQLRKKVVMQELLSPDFMTIPEALKANGYATFGVSTNPHMYPGTGFERGFDRFAGLWFSDALATNEEVAKLKEEIGAARPYFLWVHYFDPHDPYLMRDPWIREYAVQRSACKKWARMTMKEIRERQEEIAADPEALRALGDLYDSEIAFTDNALRELFELLAVDEKALVIITSDHGEGFLDHGLLGHGNSLFEELIRVPLVVALPAGEARARSVAEAVSITDVFPTILAAAGAAVPAGIDGKSLLPLVKGAREDTGRTLLAEQSRGPRENYLKAIRQRRWKAIFRGDELEEPLLFDLETDPLERKNAADERAGGAGSMRDALGGWLEAHPEFEAPLADRGMEKNRVDELRSLGYLDD